MLLIAILINLILLIWTRTPKLIKHLSTDKFLTAMGSDISLIEDKKRATQFCLKVVDGFNNLSIQLCDKDEVDQAEQSSLDKNKNEQHELLNSKNKMLDDPQPTGNKIEHDGNSLKRSSLVEDSLKRSSLVEDSLKRSSLVPISPTDDNRKIEEGESAMGALGGAKKPRKGKPNDDAARLSLTVQAPVLDTEKMTGIEVNLEPERPTPAQAFQIIQADDAGTVRIMNGSLCLTLKESDGTIGKKSDQMVAAPCNPKDLNNQFRFVNLGDDNKRQLDETKLSALKEAARVSPKLREKIGMDYLEMMS